MNDIDLIAGLRIGDRHAQNLAARVRQAGDSEDNAVVVEPTTRIKQHHPNWTPQTLAPYVSVGDSVCVSS